MSTSKVQTNLLCQNCNKDLQTNSPSSNHNSPGKSVWSLGRLAFPMNPSTSHMIYGRRWTRRAHTCLIPGGLQINLSGPERDTQTSYVFAFFLVLGKKGKKKQKKIPLYFEKKKKTEKKRSDWNHFRKHAFHNCAIYFISVPKPVCFVLNAFITNKERRMQNRATLQTSFFWRSKNKETVFTRKE